MGIDSQWTAAFLHVLKVARPRAAVPIRYDSSAEPRRAWDPCSLPLRFPRLFNLSDVLVLRMTAGLGEGKLTSGSTWDSYAYLAHPVRPHCLEVCINELESVNATVEVNVHLALSRLVS